jgi:hypothetical protein
MEQFVQGMKSTQRPTSVVLWVIITLGVATFVLWTVVGRISARERSREWTVLDRDGNANKVIYLKDLEDLAHDHPGTEAGRIARLQRARILLQDGMDRLCTSRYRVIAKDDLEQARKLYQDLAGRLNDNLVLKRQALLGAARAEEALIAASDSDDAPEQLKQALDAYDRYLKAADPESPIAQKVAEHVKQLEKDPHQVANFYNKLNRLADEDAPKFRSSPTDAGGLGQGLPPLPVPKP